MKKILMIMFSVCQLVDVAASELQPYFDKQEYIEMLKINQKAHIALDKWVGDKAVPVPDQYDFIYRSPVVAFDNIWDLWVHKNQKIAVIAVQGSIQTEASFLANLYAAMVPAKGEIQLQKGKSFEYNLSDNPNAAVHVGWLVAMANLSSTIEDKIDSCYKTGIKDFILTGHSQGAGITFLLTSYLLNLKAHGRLPGDIQFKTYCSAGPKPGNLYYAYDYERKTKGGWAYNVINPVDWVPEVPFSIQTVDDFTTVNPFRHAKKMIRQQKFPKNIALKYVYNQLSKPGKKAQKRYEKYLGNIVSKAVRKQIPDLVTPGYYHSNYYVRIGPTIVLNPDEEYFTLYSNDPNNPNVWQHHLPKQYLFLVERLENNVAIAVRNIF
ncbi:lipase family protein [Niabella ginsengisoli]|uniref:Lipase family protein n=1 Tax=Niabella ginsengisoli TaxID=522298 RepID=A0ABS9SG81_9BACT|nr:lipase family protein [Niabella ginsengisoli]MCH5597372.1 lipase family protein [Niabella ginsengisoli]